MDFSAEKTAENRKNKRKAVNLFKLTSQNTITRPHRLPKASTDRPTDSQTNRQVDRRTHPLGDDAISLSVPKSAGYI